MDCTICNRHKTSNFITERSGIVLAHFPKTDSEPSTKGHLLIEPRRHITDLTELTDDEAAALGLLLRDGVRAIRAAIPDIEHVYSFRINDKVPHLHFHLVPRYPNTPSDFFGQNIMKYLGSPKLDLDQIRALTQKLKQYV